MNASWISDEVKPEGERESTTLGRQGPINVIGRVESSLGLDRISGSHSDRNDTSGSALLARRAGT
jgi:hypothetical protein